MKILELTRDYEQGMVAINIKYIISVLPESITNSEYKGGKTRIVCHDVSYTVMEDYETIIRMLMEM